MSNLPGPRPSPLRRRRGAPPPPTPVDPSTARPTIRVSSLYGTSWRTSFVTGDQNTLTDSLSLGRLERFYRASADQLPSVIVSRPVDASTVWCERWREGTVVSARMWLFALPTGQVVVGLTLDVDCTHLHAVNLLEDCYYLTLTIDGGQVEQLVAAEARAHGLEVDTEEFTAERHQIVYSAPLEAKDPADVVQRLIYRANLPYRPGYGAISYPGELNRRPNTTAAIGPYVSVLFGQQDYIENAALVSAVQAVASSVRLREIRNALYHDLREFHAIERAAADTRTRRRTLEQITDDLTRLELDLSVSVEAPGDLGVLVPSLRVIEYHNQVYASIGIRELADTVSRMLRRLEATGRAELTSVESIERRADEDRRLRWAVAIGFVSVVAVPISLILAFFGINTTQVTADRSMFDPAYLWVYASIGLLLAISTGLAVSLYVHQARQQRRYLTRRTDAAQDLNHVPLPHQRQRADTPSQPGPR